MYVGCSACRSRRTVLAGTVLTNGCAMNARALHVCAVDAACACALHDCASDLNDCASDLKNGGAASDGGDASEHLHERRYRRVSADSVNENSFQSGEVSRNMQKFDFPMLYDTFCKSASPFGLLRKPIRQTSLNGLS